MASTVRAGPKASTFVTVVGSERPAAPLASVWRDQSGCARRSKIFDIPSNQTVNLSNLGTIIRERREALGLTQSRLAQLSGLSRQTLVGLEASALSDLGSRSCRRYCVCRSTRRRRRRHHRACECPLLDRVRGHRHPRHGHAVRQRVSLVDSEHDLAAKLCLAPGGHRGGDGRHPAARHTHGDPGAVRAAAASSVRRRRRRWVRPACDPTGLRRMRVGQPLPLGEVPALGGAGAGLVCPVPGPVRWERCVVLGALLTGGLASVQWAYYKKHM